MNSKIAPLNAPKKLLTTTVAVMIAFSGCASKPTKPEGADELRTQLTELQSDAQLGPLAPIAMKETDEAVKAAEQPRKDARDATSEHLVFVAKTRLAIARAMAQRELYESQRKGLTEKRYDAQLQNARGQTSELQKQIADLNAKATERGLVMTLGDVLFATGKSELKPGATNNLAKLLAFLNQHPESRLTIEGHTDSAGDDAYNLSLSQRRADTVKTYLVTQGINSDRINAVGKGESFPVADNNTPAGRQLNRRVEIIITDMKGA